MDCTSIKMKWNVDEWVSIFNFLSIAQTDPQIKKSNDSWWMRISSSSINGYGVADADLHSVFHMHHFHTLWIHSCWRCWCCTPNRILLVVPNNSVFIFSYLYSLCPAAHYITRWYSVTVSHSSLTHDFMNTFICTLHATSSVPAAGSRKKKPEEKRASRKKAFISLRHVRWRCISRWECFMTQ